MKKTFFLLTSLVFVIISYGQGYDPEKINKKAVTIYNQALEKAQGRDYKAAIDLLLQSINIDGKYVSTYI